MDAVRKWLSEQKQVLDSIMSEAAIQYEKDHAGSVEFSYDLSQCSREMFNLAGTGDVCYDRPSIGFVYGLWYHGNRVSALLGRFEKIFLSRIQTDKHIEVYDLGAGTGAIQWAIALLYTAASRAGLNLPTLRLLNIDSSPFMLDYNQKYLWPEFLKKYPECHQIKVEFSVNNWINHVSNYQGSSWICASYLFDHSENKESLTEEFIDLLNRTSPSVVMLFTSNQKIQKEYVNEITNAIRAVGYLDLGEDVTRQFYYEGDVELVHQYRQGLQARIATGFSGTPNWSRSYFYNKSFLKQQATLSFATDTVRLYASAETDRMQVRLTPQQRAASIPSSQPTIITGPAGCGKTIVISERVKNIVENVAAPYDPKLKILITTFNTRLVDMLGGWLEKILDNTRAKRYKYQTTTQWGIKNLEHSYFVFRNSNIHNIEIVHFEGLARTVGGMELGRVTHGAANYKIYHRHLLSEVAESYFSSRPNLDRAQYSKIIDPDFLMEEFERIFYGLQIGKRNQYMKLERVGRGKSPALQYDSLRRKIVYDIIRSYIKRLDDLKLDNFHLRRAKFLKKLIKGEVKNKFDHVFVDELQDCTYADYQIFFNLLSPENSNNITFAGDLAQSIQLGGAFHVPRGEDMKRYKRTRLEGSFRLPFRISQCIKPLSEKIANRYGKREGVEAEVIVPFKGAQPGARPIVVYAENERSMALKIDSILKAYSLYTDITPTLFEKDEGLKNQLLIGHLRNINSEIILRSKGLEYPCIIWSSRKLASTNQEQEEFVYTIFTRTSAILIIAVFNEIDARMRDIVKIFSADKAIYWDAETESHLLAIGASPAAEEPSDVDETEQVLSSGQEENSDIDEFS